MLEQVRLTAQKATTALKVLQIRTNTLVLPVLTTPWKNNLTFNSAQYVVLEMPVHSQVWESSPT